MPRQLVKDRKNDATVGPQTRARSRKTGIPTIRPRRILSRRVRTLKRPRLRGTEAACGPGGATLRIGRTPASPGRWSGETGAASALVSATTDSVADGRSLRGG